MFIILHVTDLQASHTLLPKSSVETTRDPKDSMISAEPPTSIELAKTQKLVKSYKRCIPSPWPLRSFQAVNTAEITPSHLKISHECTFKEVSCYQKLTVLKPSGLLISCKSPQDCTSARKKKF